MPRRILLTIFILMTSLHAFAAEKSFSEFSAVLPEGWDGEEQTGFVTGNPDEYQLTLGRMDEQGEKFLALVNIYILPNKNGVTAEEAARQLQDAQKETSGLKREGKLLVFTGEPASNVLRGKATTFVNVTPEKMLIIIVQDPDNIGGNMIIDTLKGATPQARDLLGK